ncbi:MAG TPA: RluA family pseudouridine synthase [Candidatus Bathyarchaeia archaeon]|nr:RluA family pseudouridine synthase [Candidatus Bathyarchaeia archaeon]
MIRLALQITPKIIYEDDFLLIVDKPSNLIVNRFGSVQTGNLQDWIEKRVKLVSQNQRTGFMRRSGLVHRLDKETSGLVIVAKREEAFTDLQSQFKKRTVQKEYLALVHGIPDPPKGQIILPIARNPVNRHRFGVFLNGREAETNYQSTKNYVMKFGRQTRYYSLLKLYPKTGRTHQLRVHLKFANYPIVADSLYAGRKTYREDKRWCPRLFLHASRISFIHPKDRQAMTFSDPTPSDLANALEKLEVLKKSF